MIVTDLKCGRQFVGDLVEEIPGGRALSDEQLEKYLKVRPDDGEKYQQYKRPSKARRMVIKRHVGDGYYLIPMIGDQYRIET